MIRRITRSLTFRLALMFSIAAFVVLLVLGFVVLYVVNQHFIAQDRMMLEAQAKHIEHTLHNVEDTISLQSQLQYLAATSHDEHGFIVLIVDQSKQIMVIQSNLADSELSTIVKSTQQVELTNWNENQLNYRVLYQPVVIAGQPATLIVALNIVHHQDFLDSFQYSMWGIMAIAALMMGLLACMVAKRGLKPLHTLIAQTSQITIDNLSQRLPVSQSYSEISQLTFNVNEMLNRLDTAFKRLIGFSSDLAHELRTPLSTMKMQHQVMLSRTRSIEEYQQVLQDSSQELEHLTRMVTDMLFLAKSDNGLITPDHEPVILHDEITRLYDFYDYIAQDKKITLNLSGEATIYGDKTLIRRALSNLITNALTYSDTNSAINIQVTQTPEQIQITIDNQGETIDPAHLPHLFERFYRVDSARSHSAEGVGLGLAITASIIQAHQGKITVTSANHLTCFTILLPK